MDILEPAIPHKENTSGIKACVRTDKAGGTTIWQKLWDRDAHLMTDDKLTVTEEKAVDFEDGHSLDIGVDGLDDSPQPRWTYTVRDTAR